MGAGFRRHARGGQSRCSRARSGSRPSARRRGETSAYRAAEAMLILLDGPLDRAGSNLIALFTGPLVLHPSLVPAKVQAVVRQTDLIQRPDEGLQTASVSPRLQRLQLLVRLRRAGDRRAAGGPFLVRTEGETRHGMAGIGHCVSDSVERGVRNAGRCPGVGGRSRDGTGRPLRLPPGQSERSDRRGNRW